MFASEALDPPGSRSVEVEGREGEQVEGNEMQGDGVERK